MIQHAEQLGVTLPKRGVYGITEALARLARDTQSAGIRNELVDRLSYYPELQTIQTVLQIDPAAGTAHDSWVQEAFNLFAADCKKKCLPVPKIIRAEDITEKQIAICVDNSGV